jgi:hypothetical protein
MLSVRGRTVCERAEGRRQKAKISKKENLKRLKAQGSGLKGRRRNFISWMFEPKVVNEAGNEGIDSNSELRVTK